MSPADVTPPAWAQTILLLILDSGRCDTIAGDLLEQYRDEVVPSRGRAAANRWYVAQVASFLTRTTWAWAAAFAAAFFARNLYDWLVPTSDFLLRSEISTAIAVSLVGGISLRAAWRAHAILAGPLAATAMLLSAALINAAASAVVLAVWHDPETLRNAQAAGGLAEVFILPVFLGAPALLLGTAAGVIGRAAAGVWGFVRPASRSV